MTEIIIQSDAGDGRTSAVFEDNGYVAYCYLLVSGAIRSDVWVYNRTPAPIGTPWKEGLAPPYLNPADYAIEMDPLPSSTAEVSVEWRSEGQAKPMALVKIRGRLFATVSADTKPGYASLARKAGPLAKPLLE